MATVEFRAFEYHDDASFQKRTYRFEGDMESGWHIFREGKRCLELPQGYRLLKSVCCGICATDLSRHHLPFPLPQITGHEVIAQEESGRLVAVEINASHLSSGSPAAEACSFCRGGLPTHCPDRLVLGIDRLPGGFSPWMLVPQGNIIEVPSSLTLDMAVLLEPFASALHAAQRIELAGVERVAVLGVGRLGLLLIAALNITREAMGEAFTIEAIDRHQERLDVARQFGADVTWPGLEALINNAGSSGTVDVAIEATGSQQGFAQALSLASREVHVKSTTGLDTLGLRHLTELVVDEICLASFNPDDFPPGMQRPPFSSKALILGPGMDHSLRGKLEKSGCHVSRIDDLEALSGPDNQNRLPVDKQAGIVVVDSMASIDLAIRPRPGMEMGLVGPRGTILIADVGQTREGLLGPVLDEGKRISTSRCGDFHRAIPAMESLLALGVDLGPIITDHMPVSELPAAFERACSPGSIKVVVTHGAAE